MAFALLRRSNRSAPRTAAPIPRGAGALDCVVLDPVQLPLHRAEVSVRDTEGREVVHGQTDPNGCFSATVAPGEYSIAVTSDGFQPVRQTCEATAGARTATGPMRMELAPSPAMPEPGRWKIDPDHTAVRFIARHIGLAEIHGRFNRFEGALWIAERMEESQLEVTIDAASIDTGVEARDQHLRSQDFLDVNNYPYLQFASERFVHRGGSRWSVQGVLSLHGVSRSINLDTRYLGIGTGIMGETRTACSAATELHREDFTLDWRTMLARGIAAIGATIRIELDIQAIRDE
ncbi:YceI family protein [Streptomyces sp. NPDC050617]|uniref:YceI family protein n=1 Tax=Streptomyces sp. NPDC050617 TaxID=3154628 RepID=UPI003419ED33